MGMYLNSSGGESSGVTLYFSNYLLHSLPGSVSSVKSWKKWTLCQSHYSLNLKMPDSFFPGITSSKESELGPRSFTSRLWLRL